MTDHDAEQPELPSKSQRKRDAHALQKLGEQLIQLSEEKLAHFSLPDQLFAAIRDMHKIRQHGARKRQLQYIGKLMRQTDITIIESELNKLNQSNQQQTDSFHHLEQWRDRLLQDEQSLSELIAQYPAIDRQHIRQLIRNASKETQQQKPPRAARQLFQYLREVIAPS